MVEVFKYDVFVSYAHADDNDDNHKWVSRFVETIKRRYEAVTSKPLAVFFDENDLKSFEAWKEHIYDALQTARVLLTVMSPAYFKSTWFLPRVQNIC